MHLTTMLSKNGDRNHTMARDTQVEVGIFDEKKMADEGGQNGPRNGCCNEQAVGAAVKVS